MCNEAVREGSWNLRHVPDWFVTYEQLNLWCDDDYVYNDHDMTEWYDGYKKRKAQKAKIKEELLSIAWHRDCVMDWCMLEDEKRRWK